MACSVLNYGKLGKSLQTNILKIGQRSSGIAEIKGVENRSFDALCERKVDEGDPFLEYSIYKRCKLIG